MTYRDSRRTQRAETIRRKQIRTVKYQTTTQRVPEGFRGGVTR